MWYHIKCKNVSAVTYGALQKSSGVHWYCKGCDKGVSTLLQTLAQMHQRQDTFEKELTVIRKDRETSSKEINRNMKKVTDKLEEICGIISQAKWRDDISRMKTEINMDLGMVRQELNVVEMSVTHDDRRERNDDEECKKFEKEVRALKTELDSKVIKTVIGVKEHVEETLEIERRKMNLVIYGVPERMPNET